MNLPGESIDKTCSGNFEWHSFIPQQMRCVLLDGAAPVLSFFGGFRQISSDPVQPDREHTNYCYVHKPFSQDSG